MYLNDFHNPSKIRYKDSDPVISYININNAFDTNKLEQNF